MNTYSTQLWICYTYFIMWSSTGMKYYGARWAKGCHPTDLFVKYFTSSKYVKNYIKLHGNPDIIQIRKTFEGSKEGQDACYLWETKVLQRMNVVKRIDYLNQHDNNGILRCKEYTKEMRIKQSLNHADFRGSKNPYASYTGNKHHQYNKPRTDEVKKKISESNKGKHNPIECAQRITKEMRDATSKRNIEIFSKMWQIKFPNGETIIVKNLKLYCSKNNLPYQSIKKSSKNPNYSWNGITCLNLSS